MLRKSLLIAILFTILALNAEAQWCNQMKIYNEGVNYTIKRFDAQQKLTSTAQNNLIKIQSTDGGSEFIFNMETTDFRGKPLRNDQISFICNNNGLFIDLRSMVNPYNMKGFEKMDIAVDEYLMEMPLEIKNGDKLKDGYLKMNITEDGEFVATVELKIFNRVVQGKEKVKTEAGKFEAWKIKYEIEMITTTTIPLKIISTGIDWFSPVAGIVKSETYNRHGKLAGVSLLSKITAAEQINK